MNTGVQTATRGGFRRTGRRLLASTLALASTVATFAVGVQPAAAAPSVVADKRVSDTSPAPGTPFTYSIRFRCASTFEHCTGAQLVDNVPAGMTIVSNTGSGGLITGVAKTGNSITWTLKDPLPAGSTGLVTVTASYPSCADPGFDPAPETNTATFSSVNGGSAVATAPAVDGDPVLACPPPNPTPPPGFAKGTSGPAQAGGAMYWNISLPPTATGYSAIDDLPAELDIADLQFYPNGFGTVDVFCGGAWVTLSSTFIFSNQLPPAACLVGQIGSASAGSLRFPAIRKVRFNALAGFAGATAYFTTYVADDLLPGTKIQNCASIATFVPDRACATNYVADGVRIDGQKFRVGDPGTPYAGVAFRPAPTVGLPQGPMDLVYAVEFGKSPGNGGDVIDPVITDLLPADLEFVPESAGGTNWQEVYSHDQWSAADNLMADQPECVRPTFEAIPNYAGLGRTLLRWTFRGCVMSGGNIGSPLLYVYFSARIKSGTPSGTHIFNVADISMVGNAPIYSGCTNYVNDGSQNTVWPHVGDRYDLDGDGFTTDGYCDPFGNDYVVPVISTADSSKWVKGALDSSWSRYPASGDTNTGGDGQYELFVTNLGNTPLRSIDLVDVLPWVNDVSVTSPATPRGSQWGEELVSLDSIERRETPAGAFAVVPAAETVTGFSTSKNPCRWDTDDLEAGQPRLKSAGGTFAADAGVTAPAGCDPGWTTTQAGARSFAVQYTPATPLSPGASLKLTVTVKGAAGELPVAPVTGKIAWNSFGFAAETTAAAPNDRLLSTEPIQVGLKMVDTAVTASIGDYVWIDSNHDGIQNESTGVENVQVGLYRPGFGPDGIAGNADDANRLDVTYTDASGLYGFYGLIPDEASYQVRLDRATDFTTGALRGYDLTAANIAAAGDTDDSDGALVAGVPTIGSTPTLAPGTHTPTYDFGFWLPASLGDYVWEELGERNGVQDGGEPPVVGATVRLYNAASDALIGTTTTGASGQYLFGNLGAGSFYVVFDLSTATSTGVAGAHNDPTKYEYTTPNASGDEVNDSDPDASGQTAVITLVAGQHDPRWDAGIAPIPPPPPNPASLGDYTWIDTDGDGKQGPPATEPPLEGVTVTLLDGQGFAVRSTTTNAVGFYEFLNLDPAKSYQVLFTPPPGYVPTGRDSVTGGPDDTKDSDADPASGLTDVIPPIGANNHDPKWDAGFVPTFSLGNIVWLDANDDGKRDPSDPLETGIAGVKVKLFMGDGTTEVNVGPDGKLGTADDGSGGVVTTGLGNYLFTSLPAGDYIVEIVAPAGYMSSVGNGTARAVTGPYEGTAVDEDTTPLDNDDNGSTVGALIRSAAVTLSATVEPTAEGLTPGWPDATPDGNGNYQVDFGLIVIPPAPPVGSIVVTKTVGAGDDATGVVFNFEVTSTNCDLPAVPYSISITGASTGTFSNLLLTTDAGVACAYSVAEVNVPGGWNPQTTPQAVTLPTTDPVPVAFSNLKAPAVVSLGNHVWLDSNNDGDFDSATELPIDGVTVRLFRPGYGADSVAGNADDALQIGADQLTSDGGYYLFTGLAPGDYVVEVVTPAGTRSSTGGVGDPFDGLNVPDADDVATDSDDNGYTVTATTTRSKLVTVTVGAEPTGEPATSGHADTTPDSSGNYTVDFGFTPIYAIGNIVWFDAVPNGIRDIANAAETPVQGAIVRLFTAAGVEVPVGADGVLGTADDGLDGVTTGPDGQYYFDNLVGGDYYVVFTAPSGYEFTTNAPAVADALNDSNPAPATGQTPNFALASTLPAVDAAAGDRAGLVAPKIDRTIDAGLIVRYSLGNRVWFDADNSGDMGAAELAIKDVVVNLLNADGTPHTVGGVAVTDTTDADGFYRFDSLLAGDYIVEIAASNFVAGGPLEGGLPSTGAAQEADPDSDVDVNDNGLDPLVAGAIRSAVVTLGTGLASEPLGEVAGQLEPSGQGAVDGRGNMTVDFGIYVPTYAIGNVVWFDADRDGMQDGGAAEPPVAGAVVQLFTADGTEVPVGPDGVLGTADDAIGGVTTLANGLYYFDDIGAGDYYITFTPPTGYALTIDGAALTTTNDSNPNPVTGRTPDFALGQTLPNVDLAEGDPATLRGDKIDRTIDAGLVVSFSLGNRVWFDADNSGDMGATESPAKDVVVNLLKADGTPVLIMGVAATDTTDVDGFYRFDNLPAGDYIVEIAASNFGVAGPLKGGHPSTGVAQEANPNADGDINDNGLDTLVAGAIRSGVVTLGPGQLSEPLGEVAAQLEASGQGTVDERANMTVDFGIYTPRYNLGNLVWSDFDNDGLAEPGEAPIEDVVVTLEMQTAGTFGPATDADGNPVGPETTGPDGKYLFENLLEGTYRVMVAAGQSPLAGVKSSGIPNPTAGDDTDNDNNAVPQADGSFQSGPVTLGPLSSEPSDESDGLITGQPDEDTSTGDLLHNWSVDFGFFRGIRIGNLVWLDGLPGDGATYDNGVVDAGETPIGGVTVELWRDNGNGTFDPAADTKINTSSTDSDGNYYFENVTPGDQLFIAIPSVAAAGALGVRSSTGASTGPVAADNDDDGAPIGAYVSVSGLFTAPAIGAAPIGETDAIPAADGSAETEADTNTNVYPDGNSDLRIDFGFVDIPLYRVGNLVWIDADKDGIADVGEAPVVGVRVELFNDGVFSGFVMTGPAGKYLFENLTAGTYEVRIPTGQAVLDGFFTSPVDEANADANGDNNDNGTLHLGGLYWTSGTVTLGDGNFAAEPVNEVNGLLDGTTDDDAGVATSPDNRSNLTVDFGFYQPRFAIGNEVWFDLDDSGDINNGEAYVPNGVIVNLLDGTGSPVLDAGGVARTTTTTAGRYVFDNLLVGDYIVELAAANFAAGGLLEGYASSTGQTAGDSLADDRNDHGDDDTTDGIQSTVISLSEGVEPAGENPNETTTAPDTNANMTIDFGLYVTFAIGNEVWVDLDDSGALDNGEDYVPDGVVVNLLHADGSPVMIAGTAVSMTTVVGKYLFDELPAGDYVVELAAANFAAGGILEGYRSSTLNGVDDQTDQDDNGAPIAGGAIRTGVITLGGVGAEPLTENPTSTTVARDSNGDLTVDLGVVPIFALGNEVWIDLDDSGALDNGEDYVTDGVVVNLLHGDGTPVTSAGVAVSTTTTGGKYLFDGLIEGDYIVELAASNFAAGGVLVGYRSSTFDGTDDQVDQDDNGAAAAGGSIRTGTIHLGGVGLEPNAENPTSVTSTRDTNGDLTVDLGVVPVFAIGNEVWYDLDDSGDINGTEAYVPDGVVVNLLHPDGTPVLNAANAPRTTTTAGGKYLFDNLLAGDYVAELSASNFMPAGLLQTFRSSTGQTLTDGLLTDGMDHGDDVESDGVRSATITLGLNAEPVAEDPQSTTVAADANANMTGDFGIVPLYSLGNEVWFDLDDSGAINGTEPYVADGVIVNLLHGDGTAVLDAAGNPLATSTVGGKYLFDDLLEGDYIVELAATNLNTGGLLAGYRSSTLNAGDDQVDRNDNGAPVVGGAIRSTVIHLGGIGAEPTAETPTSPTTARDNNSDLTVDFGIVPSFSIGNEVWYDLDDSGTLNGAERPVPAGVKVNLLKADGTPVLNAGAPVTTTTDVDGRYLFAGLLAGGYIVELDASNFAVGGLLAGSRSSTTNGGDDGVDRDDNGAPVVGGAIRSGVIVLSLAGEPLAEFPDNDTVTRDENEDLTVDFGIVPLFSIGNEIWMDINDDGMRDPATEAYVANGVKVNLLHADGTAVLDGAGVAKSTTTANGLYLFDALLNGSYMIEIDTSNFAAGGLLYGYRSSTPSADQDAVDHDDNGESINTTAPFISGIRSVPFVLSFAAEPTAETPDNDTFTLDGNENLTVDFGVFRPTFSLGNQVWIDLNDNGIVDAGEPVVANGTVVRLYNEAGMLQTTATTTDGLYLFAGLSRGSYYVEIDLPTGFRSSTPTEISDVDERDRGAQVTGSPIIRSVVITLDEGTELLGEQPDNDALTPDGNENLTVDLGLVPMLSLGNEIWHDLNDNGVLDTLEPYVADGVVVNLLHADGTPVLDTAGVALTTTTAGGMYLFDDLIVGDYIVEIAAANFAAGGLLEHWTSSTGQSLVDTITDDQHDHGAALADLSIRSAVINLAFLAEPTAEDPSNDELTIDANSNLTIDFGLVRLAVGNRLWIDTDGDGLRDADEPGVGGVTVELWASDATGPIGTAPLVTTTTDPTGYYLFDGLATGTYVVRIPASQLTTGGPLAGYISTEGNGTNAPDADNNTDNDDNGTQDETTGWVQTLPFDLAPGAEATAETDLAAGTDQMDGTLDLDANINLTVDLGFVVTPPLSLGNRVWADSNNDGIMNGTETPIEGVTVQLFRDDNGDGVPDSDVAFQTDITAGGGYYLFTGLAPGKYIVVIPASNFVSGGPLSHTVSSTGSTLADNGVDVDDSGIQKGGPSEDVRSSTVTLSFYDEPTAEGQIGPDADLATDVNSNLTVDFGFYPLGSLGDYVWIDTNRNGIQDPGEPGVDGVKVNLYDNNGTLIATTVTAGGGKYLFEDLIPGPYTVEFVISTIPSGYLPTILGGPSGDEATDSDADPVTGRTVAFTVVSGGHEPRVDFGIIRAQVDLSIVKTFDGEVAAGQNSTWKLIVSNTGLDPETGMITVVDTLPAQLSFVSAAGQGWQCSGVGQLVTCTTDVDLPAGGKLPTIILIAKVATGTTGSVINGATVSSPGEEATPSNNGVSAAAPVVKAGKLLPGTGAAIGGVLSLGGLLLALGLVALGLVGRRSARRRRITTA